jgi:hypothetical protein
MKRDPSSWHPGPINFSIEKGQLTLRDQDGEVIEGLSQIWNEQAQSMKRNVEKSTGKKLPDDILIESVKRLWDAEMQSPKTPHNKRIPRAPASGSKPPEQYQDWGLFDGEPELKSIWLSLPDELKDEALRDRLKELQSKKPQMLEFNSEAMREE